MKYPTFRPVPAAFVALIALFCAASFTGSTAAFAADRTLTISSGPVESGVPITLTVEEQDPEEIATPHVEHVQARSLVTLSAPETFQHRPFIAWWLNGFNFYSLEREIEFELDLSSNFIAVYGAPKVTLSVTSSPEVGIEFLNEDIETKVTPYERIFETQDPYEAIINAPVTYNGKPFSRWLLNGEESSTLHVINVMMDDDYTLEAQYGSGSIKTKIQPKAARKKARWRIDGGEWLKRGATASNLRVGDHVLEWKPVAGFNTPNPRTVPVADGDSHTIRGRYFPEK